MLIKRNNIKSKVIEKLYFSNFMSCSELSKYLDKSLPYIVKIIEELEEEGIVEDTGFAPSTGGRRPILYSLKPDTFYIISVSMDQLITRIALIDSNKNFIGNTIKIDLDLGNTTNALSVLKDNLITFIESLSINKNQIIGIGIGMPGFVDSKKGINYTFLKFLEGEESIPKYLQNNLGIPVFIDNDSCLIALAEYRFGIAMNRKNVLVINLGWGVGLGIIINGDLYRGDLGFSGEFSHIPLFTNNKLCSCGKSGCLETETSLLALIEKVKEKLNEGRVSKLKNILTVNQEEAYKLTIKYGLEGDQLAVELISDIGHKIGRGIAILIHLLNPELIVLSGRGALAGEIWKAPIQQALNEYCIPRLSAKTEIAFSKLGFEAELIGAAALVMENYEKLFSLKNDV